MRGLSKLVRLKNQAVELLEDSIFEEMERIARQRGLTEMPISPYDERFKRGKLEVAVPAIGRLVELYREEINEGDLQVVWSVEAGWH